MSRQPLLTPGKAGLLMLGLGTMALMGVPGFVTYQEPVGVLSGVVRGESGEHLEEAAVGLFDGDSLALLEITRSDERGRFAFQSTPWSYHVLALPPEGRGLVGRWLLSRESERGAELELSCPGGRSLSVEVTDESGRPIEGAEVRAYDTEHTTACVARTTTDAEGRAALLAPRRAHVAVLAEHRDKLPAWRFDQELDPSGEHLVVQLDARQELTGSVEKPDGRPMPGLVVTARDPDRDDAWYGFALTDRQGRFSLGGREGCELRCVDPAQRLLPVVRKVLSSDEPQDLIVRPGEPMQLECTDAAGDARPSRVWIWSEEANAWSWGGRTDDQGRLQARVSSLYSVVAVPLYEMDGAAIEAWDLVREGEQLVLRAER